VPNPFDPEQGFFDGTHVRIGNGWFGGACFGAIIFRQSTDFRGIAPTATMPAPIFWDQEKLMYGPFPM